MHFPSGLIPAFIISLFLGLCVSNLHADEISLPSDLSGVSLVEVSKNIYVLHGIHAMPDQKNVGLISNSGVILTASGAIVVDSGGSYAVGRLMVQKIKEITDKPIIAVFNSHIHGDHWLGNSAIRESFPNAKFYAHKKAIQRLKSGEAENWLDIMQKMVGKKAAGLTFIPDQALEGGENIKIDNLGLKIHHTGHAHTDSDIMVEVPGNRLLFTGDVVEYGRLVSSDVPRDFNAKGQIEAIKFILNLPIDIYVPGHGETGGKEIPEAALKFLQLFYESVERNYNAGLADYEMKEQVSKDLSAYSGWFNYDQLGRMISFVFQQIESADFK